MIKTNQPTPTRTERLEARLYLIGGALAASWFIGGMIYLYGVGRFW